MITQAALTDFRAVAGPQGLVEDQDLIAPWLSDWRDKYHGCSVAMLVPRSTEQVSAMMKVALKHPCRWCRRAVTVRWLAVPRHRPTAARSSFRYGQ